MTKSTPLPKYSIRAGLVWLIPLLSLVFGCALLVPFLLSVAVTPVEIPKLREQIFGKRAKRHLPCLRAPALMRLGVLWLIQAWWIILWREGLDAPVSDEFAINGAGDQATSALRGVATPLSTQVDAANVWSPKTLSVVLPCAGEGEFALNTVRAVFESTPSEALQEIIVVDDGSDPPLGNSHLPPSVVEYYRVKIIRHSETVGLIGAKQDGGVAASGDIIVFFDCHVAPQVGWHASFLRLIGENYKRVVVPMITDLDVSTWQQKSASAGMAKCYLTWDADFKWFSSDDPYVPVLSGGLLGISRQWWNRTRGYDEHMRGWGGENLDQSLRTWLCGGEIMMAKDAEVAHMWRVSSDPRTHPKYVVPTNAAAKNRMRAAVAWFGEYAEKLRQFPELRAGEQAADGTPWYGDISNIVRVKTDLQCKSYSWFMRRFQHVYEDAGLVPREVFHLKSSSLTSQSGGQCLTYTGAAGTSPDGRGTATLKPCDPWNDRQQWHLANRDASQVAQPCCSGIRAWNTDQCIATARDGNIETYVCDVSGKTSSQVWSLTTDGRLEQKGSFLGNTCIDAGTGKLFMQSCGSGGGIWIKENPVEPIESRLYRKASLSGFVA